MELHYLTSLSEHSLRQYKGTTVGLSYHVPLPQKVTGAAKPYQELLG